MRIAYLSLIEVDKANACLVHTREIAEQMAELGHEVTLFLPKPLRLQKWTHVNQVWINLWGFGGLRETLFHLESAFRFFLSHLERRFDFLYMREMNNHGLIPYLCKWFHLPLFIEVNGWFLDDLKLKNVSSRKILQTKERQRLLFHKAKGIVASTFGVAEKISEIYEVDKQKIFVQQLGSNPAVFKPGDKKKSREILGLPAHAEIFLFAGSFSQNHDLSLLLSAFSLYLTNRRLDFLRNCRNLVSGSGCGNNSTHRI
jgi:hypothetical protein